MIFLPTASGGRVEHLGSPGRVVTRGMIITRVVPDQGPIEEIIAPFDALVAVQRLQGATAPRYSKILGLRRVVVATCAGRVRWLSMMGPLGVDSLVALIDTEGRVRPHRAGAVGWVGELFTRAGAKVAENDPLVEVRGEEMA